MGNRTRKNVLKCTVISIAVVFLSCSWGKIQTKNYYLISYTPASPAPATSQRPYRFALQVGRFEVQRIFNRQNILYRYSSHQIQYYELQHWAVRPDYMITDMVFKHLEASNLTNRVGIDFFETRPDFKIEGMVDALEKLDAGDLFFAHLAMSLKMVRVSDGAQIWAYSFDERKQVYQQEIVYTVRGLSSILQNQMEIVISQLDSLFLSMETGIQPPRSDIIREEPAEESVKETSTSEDLDESSFEIIPEKKQPREEQ